MIYGNEAAPDLTFSREPTHANELNEKELERKIKRGKKKLAKKTRDAIAQGKRFTEMGSAEFDVLFGATDRNNEVQFRLLFTPLAQVNMLDLIKSDEGYGDDFAFRKQGCINRIRSEHAQRWQAEIDPSRFAGYDLAAVRKDFIACAAEYLKSVFFDLAPCWRCRCIGSRNRRSLFIGMSIRSTIREKRRKCSPINWGTPRLPPPTPRRSAS